MTTVNLYNIEGKKTGSIDLPETIFGLESNGALLHQVYVSQSANRRIGSASTKKRSDVRGGGRKPWKQKGTGNARAGSIRNPIWRGGGIVFGPSKDKNFSKSINAKMKRNSMLVALSEKARSGKICIIESLVLDEIKTRKMSDLFNNIEIKTSALVGLSSSERNTYKAIRNIEKKKACEVEKFNTYDIMNSDFIVISKEGIKILESQFIK